MHNVLIALIRLYTWNAPIQFGKRRLVRMLMRHFPMQERRRQKTRFGAIMDLDLSQIVQCRIYFEGQFEKELLDVMKAAGTLFSSPVVFDVGANVGQHSLFAVLQMHAGSVHAFEPCRETLLALRNNVKLNDLQKVVHIHDIALSDKAGTASLKSPANHNDGMNYLSFDHDNDQASISTGTLDNFANDKCIERIDFLKLDVEGAEFRILCGAGKLLERGGIHVMAVEICQSHLKRFGNCPMDIFNCLDQHGYTGFVLNRHGLTQISKDHAWRPIEESVFVHQKHFDSFIHAMKTSHIKVTGHSSQFRMP